MAPDLNSVPPSPRAFIPPRQPASTSPSRRPSTMMPSTSSLSSTAPTPEQFPAMPVRHSRPMTPAELHNEVEKEQEAVVNRLTRELSQLRAHSSSIASTTSNSSVALPSRLDPSSASASAIDTSAPSSTPRHPTSIRHHRSSSSLSSRTRSLTSSSPSFAQPPTVPTTAPNPPPIPTPGAGGATTTHSQASVDRARDAVGLPHAYQHAPSRSRQNSIVHGAPPQLPLSMPSPSISISARSLLPTPTPSPSTAGSEGAYFHPRSESGTYAARVPTTNVPSSARVEELGQAKAALEAACAEKDELVGRIRELEVELRGRSGRDH